MIEMDETKEWTSTVRTYTKTYIKVKPSYSVCAHCGKELKPDIWYIQINDEIYCSEECVLAMYDWLEPFFLKK